MGIDFHGSVEREPDLVGRDLREVVTKIIAAETRA